MINFFSKENVNRYPYTFAYDWIKTAGLAESRGDAASWFRNKFPVDADRLSNIEKAADEYIDHYNKVNDLEAFKEKTLSAWKSH